MLELTGPAAIPTGGSLDTTPEGEGSGRLVCCAAGAMAVVAVAYLWVLGDLWTGRFSLLRTSHADGSAANFYDLQARALLHGHLDVPPGSLGAEAFVHAGHQYTYFGLFPSLLRLPVELFTHRLDGRLTAPSMLLAWVVTGAMVAALLVRLRPPGRLGWAEACTGGVFVAVVTGGSVLVFLASDPEVFSEDLAWSVALCLASLVALLGLLDDPSWRRAAACTGLVAAANLNRATTGYACAGAALLAAAWLASGLAGASRRRWWPALAGAGLLPLALSATVSWLKFGVLFGLPASDQIVYRFFDLARINGGHYFGVGFLPSTALAYLGPGGIRLTSTFPFVTLPAYPAAAVGSQLFGQGRTASVTATMPLLVLLAGWGMCTAVRRGRRLPPGAPFALVAGTASAGAVLLFGWIANRFLADFLPILVVGGAVGLVDLWSRSRRLRRGGRRLVGAIFAVLAVFGVAANVALSVTPQAMWAPGQALHYVETERSVGQMIGHRLTIGTETDGALPGSAPAGALAVVGDCRGLYLADGSAVPGSDDPAVAWLPVVQGPALRRTLLLAFPGGAGALRGPVPVAGEGGSTATVTVDPAGPDQVRFAWRGRSGSTSGPAMVVVPGRQYRFVVTVDRSLGRVSVTEGRRTLLFSLVRLGRSSLRVPTVPAGAAVRLADRTGPAQGTGLCRELLAAGSPGLAATVSRSGSAPPPRR